MIPRIRGKVGQAEEGPHLGKWYCNVWISQLGSGEPNFDNPDFQIGPWDTEEIARDELRIICKLASEECEKAITGKVSGEYIDMKTDTRRKWDRSDEN